MMINLCHLKQNRFFIIFYVIELLWVHVLGSKTQSRKWLIFYKIENGTSTMNKHYEVEHSNILKMYVNEIAWQRYVEMDVFEFKQSSKVQQMVIPRSICACSIVLQHIKIKRKKIKFHWWSYVGCCEGITPFKHSWKHMDMRWFGLQKDPWLVFPSCRILTEKVLPCMMKHTLEKFVFLYVNATIFIITPFDL
jgi:hypothetical protein